MDIPSTLTPTLLEVSIKFTEHSRYCVVCTPLGNTYPKEFPMPSDWDEDEKEEDQVKGDDKDRGSEQQTPQTIPRFFAVSSLTLKPPKPSITEYFGKMSSVTPKIAAPEERHRHNIIATKQEHEVQNQDRLESLD